MDTPKRYHPIMVVLHWLTVILLLGAGFLSEDEGGSSPINIHMLLGALLLATMTFRLIARFATKRPAWANSGDQILNTIGELVHICLYLFTFYILILGGVIASKRNLFGYILGTGELSFDRVGFIGKLHHLGWVAVMGLLFLHVGGALYHQFIIKDNLLNRMWFGRQ